MPERQANTHAFVFTKSAAVAVGTFNIYIVQPRWLAQIGLIEKEFRIKIESDFTRPGFRFFIPDTPIVWNVRPDRLVLEGKSFDADCGTPLAKVLRTLRWTPLTGVGTNLEFEADWSVLENIKCKMPDCPAPPGYESGQRTWHSAFHRGEQVFNLQVSAQPKSALHGGKQIVGLSINVHTEISREIDQTKASEMGQLASRQFSEHCREAVKLATEILGVDLQT
jgi:hypothetical protein